MNIINKLTLRHLRENKSRTLVTIIGVIISVAMLTAVSTLAVSFIDFAQRQHISDYGEWHALYKGANAEQVETIRSDEHTEEVILSNDLGYAVLEGSKNTKKPYVFMKEYNALGFDNFAIDIIDGVAPQADDELLISEHILTNGGVLLRVGDQITLAIGERTTSDEEFQAYELNQAVQLLESNQQSIEEIEVTAEKTFRISGIMTRPDWERRQAPGYTVLTYLDDTHIGATDAVNVSVLWNKVTNSTKADAEQLSETLQLDYSVNNDLLRYYGLVNNDGIREMLYGLAAIIMTIIVIGSVSLIYNAFAISVSERSRHLGMLASVGATKKQKRNSVFFEGFIIGTIGIPLGLISGVIGIAITLYFISPLLQDAIDTPEKIAVVITPLSLIVAALVSVVTIFISTYIPARKASRISAIDAIRQTPDVKLTGKDVKTSKLVRKLFGIEAEFGLKNLKRHKRRYQAVVLSLVVSIVLFLTVSFFTTQMRMSSEALESGVNYDIGIKSYGSQNYLGAFTDEFIDQVAGLPDITDLSYIYGPEDITALLPKSQVPEQFHEQLDAGKYHLFIDLHVLDDASLQAYADTIGVETALLTSDSHFPAIVINRAKTKDGKFGQTEVVKLATGDALPITYSDWRAEEEVVLDDLEVIAVTDHFPLGVQPGYVGEVNVVVSRDTFARLNAQEVMALGRSALYLTSDDPIQAHDRLEELTDGQMFIENFQKQRQDEEQMILLMSVFIYGFITLISAISVANIFNTISTSVALRKREFAMLKSVGMTPQGFRRMIRYESIFYGIKSLAYGLPLSALVMYLIYQTISRGIVYTVKIPWWSIGIVIIAVFLIVSVAMLYSSAKVRKETIIDGLKQENS